MNDSEKIKAIGKCCISGKAMSTSGSINIVQLEFKAWWKYPTIGNFETGEWGYATAFVHDDFIDEAGVLTEPVKYAVEFNGDDIIYHPVVKYIIGVDQLPLSEEPYIKCLICKKKSYNENDIKEAYCGNCKKFLDD